MHTVEIADGHNAASESVRDIVKMAEYAHAAWVRLSAARAA
jgi:hypothetical protein